MNPTHGAPQDPLAPQAPKTSGLAIAAFVLSIFACLPLLPFLGGILGIVALVRMSSRPHLKGKGFAIAAIPLGFFVTIVAQGILAAIAIPNFIKFQERSREAEARAEVRVIATSELAWYGEHGAFLAAEPTPAEIPLGLQPIPFDGPWKELGVQPMQGRYQYAVAVQEPGRAVVTAAGRSGPYELVRMLLEVTPEGAGEVQVTRTQEGAPPPHDARPSSRRP